MRCVAMKKQFPIISFEHASFQYEGQSQESLKDVKLIIKSGEFLVITGQSGCGKTTLTRCINNLIPRFFEGRLSGEVIVLGRSIKNRTPVRLAKRLLQFFKIPAVNFLLQTVPAKLHLPAKTMEFHIKKSLNVLTAPFSH